MQTVHPCKPDVLVPTLVSAAAILVPAYIHVGTRARLQAQACTCTFLQAEGFCYHVART